MKPSILKTIPVLVILIILLIICIIAQIKVQMAAFSLSLILKIIKKSVMINHPSQEVSPAVPNWFTVSVLSSKILCLTLVVKMRNETPSQRRTPATRDECKWAPVRCTNQRKRRGAHAPHSTVQFGQPWLVSALVIQLFVMDINGSNWTLASLVWQRQPPLNKINLLKRSN